MDDQSNIEKCNGQETPMQRRQSIKKMKAVVPL